jgi:hypothetical protein
VITEVDSSEEDTNFWIHKAESIKKSGRWAAINKQIERLASNPKVRELHFEGKQNEWLFEVFASLCAQTFEEYINLKKTHENKPGLATSEIAWRTRNLLELFVWSGYCSTDIENARRFYEDAGRDMRDLADSFIKWGAATKQEPDWIQNFSDARKDLKEKMIQKEMINLDDGYTPVREAAKKIGFQDNFRISNSILSKFAHPTAALILRPKDFEQKLRGHFYGQGCMFFCGAFDIIETWIIGADEEKNF